MFYYVSICLYVRNNFDPLLCQFFENDFEREGNMSGDIKALTSLVSVPLVREKRHYPGEQQKHQQHKNKQQQKSAEDNERDKENVDADDVALIVAAEADQMLSDNSSQTDEAENDQQKKMDNGGKNVRVMHIDEYA